MVYLHSPRVFHSLIDLSREAETIWRLSTEKATLSTSLECPTNRRVVRPVQMSQRRRVPSQEPERAKRPSEEILTSWTQWEWPVRARLRKPYSVSSRVSCQAMTDLSREDERMVSGFSWEVTVEVTHPSWPTRVPRMAKLFCSAVILLIDISPC